MALRDRDFVAGASHFHSAFADGNRRAALIDLDAELSSGHAHRAELAGGDVEIFVGQMRAAFLNIEERRTLDELERMAVVGGDLSSRLENDRRQQRIVA